MAINWKVFGTSGIVAFSDIPVHRQFLHSCPRNPPPRALSNRCFLRLPKYFATILEHAPTGFEMAKVLDKGHENLIWVNSAGRPWKGWAPDAPAANTLPAHWSRMEWRSSITTCCARWRPIG